MHRIFAPLAIVGMLVFLVSLGLGLELRQVDIRDPADLSAQHSARIHRLSGIAAALGVVLVESIVVTYFIGTSRWCREVTETYRLDPELAGHSARLKRRAFPFALAGMLAVIGVVALGGAADPAASLRLNPMGSITWTQLHLAASWLTLVLLAVGFIVQWRQVRGNQRLIARILDEVKRIRAQRGLDNRW